MPLALARAEAEFFRVRHVLVAYVGVTLEADVHLCCGTGLFGSTPSNCLFP